MTPFEREKRSRVVVVGVGNETRGDDGVGLLVARLVRAMGLDGVEVREVEGDCSRLLDVWAGAEKAVIVDAACSGAPAGTVHRLEGEEIGKQGLGMLRTSTHEFGVGEALDLGHVLGSVPLDVVIFGIEGRDFELGASMSAVAEKGARIVSELLRDELRRGSAVVKEDLVGGAIRGLTSQSVGPVADEATKGARLNA